MVGGPKPPNLRRWELEALPWRGAEAAGKAKELDACALVAVFAGGSPVFAGTCKVKKDGKVLVVKDPTVIVQKPVVDGEVAFLSASRAPKIDSWLS